MINFNGTLTIEDNLLTLNRGLLYGDGVFETMKILNGKILFSEDHYFRLMASMRIIRMEIPMNFTLEYFEQQTLTLAKSLNISGAARARLTMYRNNGGSYLPADRNASFLITASPLANPDYQISESDYEIDLYKDFYVSRQLLSSIKSTNRLLNVTASIFAGENGLQNCLLLNDSKNVAEAINGNLFMLSGNKLITPPVSEGCINGILRKQLLALAAKMENITVSEEVISPFDLQKADELFISNVITGIQPITKYRKKEFITSFSVKLVLALNASLTGN